MGEWKSAKDVWRDSSLSELTKHRVIWDLFLSKEEQARYCRDCFKDSEDCLCQYPWPTKTQAYSRAIFDADMKGLDWFSASVSHARRKGYIDGFRAIKMGTLIGALRRKCSNKLFAVRLRASDKKAPTYKEAMDSQMARDAQHKKVEAAKAAEKGTK